MQFKYLRLVSDIHLEGFSSLSSTDLINHFVPTDEKDSESILILGGDISSQKIQLIDFIKTIENRFLKVLFVQGNHEFYRHDYDNYNKELDLEFKAHLSNTFWSNGKISQEIIGNVRFIFGTLWGDGGLNHVDYVNVNEALNDFRLITKGSKTFSVFDMVEIYRRQKAHIREYLSEPFNGKTVVVTHHMPTRLLVDSFYKPLDGSDGINGGFVGCCENIIFSDIAPNLWIFGHTHSTKDEVHHNTRFVSNPAGYRSEWNSPFNSFMKLSDTVNESKHKLISIPKFINLST